MKTKARATVARMIFGFLVGVSVSPNVTAAATAASSAASWKQTLETFSNGVKFRHALREFSETQTEDTIDGNEARALLRHLDETGLTYESPEVLVQKLTRKLQEEPNSPLVHSHLLWLDRILSDMGKEAPRSQSVAQAKTAIESILNANAKLVPRDVLTKIVDSTISRHLIERQIIEERVGVSVDNPAFSNLLYRQVMDGALTDSVRRLMIGEYLKLRQFFTPTLRQLKSAATRLGPNGNLDMEFRRARQYANTRNFVRNGWSPDDDMLRIATGDMIERVYRTSDTVAQPHRNQLVERNIIMLVDSTSSMQRNGRGELRDAIVPSYIDQIFSQARVRNERVVVYVMLYADRVLKSYKITSLEQAAALFSELADNEYSIASEADHAGAMIEGVKQIIASNDKLSHLNVVLVTDGEESVNVSRVKEYTEKLTAGPEGLRLGISGISLVTGRETLKDTIEAISKSDPRYISTDTPLQYFDSAAVEKWTSDDWLQEFAGGLGEPYWVGKPSDLSGLSRLLSQIDLNESPQPRPAIVTADETSDLAQDDPAGQEELSKLNELGGGTKPGERDTQPKESDHNREENMNQQRFPHNWSNQSRQNPTVLYRIEFIDGPMPQFLGLALHDNLPRSLSGGFAQAARDRDILPVRVADGRPHRFDLALDALIRTRVVAGVAPIAKPDGYSLAGLILSDEAGNEIHGYQTFQITRNGLYLLRMVKSLPNGGAFSYKAFYVRDSARNRRSPLFNNMNAEALIEVSRQLYSDQLKSTALAVAELAEHRKINLERLAKTISHAGRYTFTEESSEPPTTSGPFALYQKFLVNGRLYYQCNGANSLLTDILEQYANAAREPSLFAENVSGYGITSSEITASEGHAVSFVSDSRIPYSYIKLDATPTEMDRKWAKQADGNRSLQRMLSWLRDHYLRLSDNLSAPIRRNYEARRERKILSCQETLLNRP